MQGREQSGLLPAGAEVQVLQPRVLQADVLQDLPGPLSDTPSGHIEPGETRREEKAAAVSGGRLLTRL